MQFFTFPETGVWLKHVWLNLCSGEAQSWSWNESQNTEWGSGVALHLRHYGIMKAAY